MSENTKIEWADHTFNPWEGCQKVSPGCDHCYAETRNARYAGGTAINWGPDAPRRRTTPANWKKPLAWNAAASTFVLQHGHRPRVFCASLADVFDNAVDPQWRCDLFELIEATPNLDWLLLTKRIGNVRGMVPLPWVSKPFQHGPDPKNIYPAGWPKHVRLGITIVNQTEADRDIPKLLKLGCPNFLSMEPLLGPVDLTAFLWGKNDAVAAICQNCPRDADCECGYHTRAEMGLPAIHQVIVGGESGPDSRPMHPAWPRDLRDQCTAAGVAFHFKQWGEWLPWLLFSDAKIDDDMEQTRYKTVIWQEEAWEDCGYPIWCDMQDNYGGGAEGPHDPDQIMGRVGKKRAGRRLDGRTWDEVPPC